LTFDSERDQKLKKGNPKNGEGSSKKKDVKVPKSNKRKSEMDDIVEKVQAQNDKPIHLFITWTFETFTFSAFNFSVIFPQRTSWLFIKLNDFSASNLRFNRSGLYDKPKINNTKQAIKNHITQVFEQKPTYGEKKVHQQPACDFDVSYVSTPYMVSMTNIKPS
jgi:hypothetical protein